MASESHAQHRHDEDAVRDEVRFEPTPDTLHQIGAKPIDRSRKRLLRHRLTLAKQRSLLPQLTARPPGRDDQVPVEHDHVSDDELPGVPTNVFTPVYTNSDEGPSCSALLQWGWKLRAAPGEQDAGGCSLSVVLHGCRALKTFTLIRKDLQGCLT